MQLIDVTVKLNSFHHFDHDIKIDIITSTWRLKAGSRVTFTYNAEEIHVV